MLREMSYSSRRERFFEVTGDENDACTQEQFLETRACLEMRANLCEESDACRQE